MLIVNSFLGIIVEIITMCCLDADDGDGDFVNDNRRGGDEQKIADERSNHKSGIITETLAGEFKNF